MHTHTPTLEWAWMPTVGGDHIVGLFLLCEYNVDPCKTSLELLRTSPTIAHSNLTITIWKDVMAEKRWGEDDVKSFDTLIISFVENGDIILEPLL